MECRELLEHLSDFVDEELEPGLRAEAEEHLGRCWRCRAAVDTTRRITVFCREAYPAEAAPREGEAERRRRFLQMLADQRP
jgi:anti-sigma factor RsiW